MREASKDPVLKFADRYLIRTGLHHVKNLVGHGRAVH
jgi:hypothetical protein